MKSQTLCLAIASTLALGACGGGGGSAGSSTSPTPVQTSSLTPITAANSGKAAASGYTASSLIGDSSSSVTGVLTGVSIGGTGMSAAAPVIKLVKRSFGQGGAPLLTGATVNQACAGGGTITVDANLRNPQTLSNGDTMSVTAVNCVEDGDRLNGTLSITIADVSGDLINTTSGAATMDTRFTGFSITSGSETATLNGDMKIALKVTSSTDSSVTISGKSLQATDQKAGATVASLTLADYSLSGSTNGNTTTSSGSFGLSGNANGLGQFAYTVKSIQPFVSVGTDMPGSGSLIVNGNASSVTVTALGAGGVRLDYSAKGDGVVTQTATLSWADFNASL
ncbi:hypothetical protein [Massilia aerilata]|uniref:Uncharacterized protein n=1 Tax=Massilia aerilata TaxID=453817 RepID=A0ABW0S542_9BURK